MCLADGREIKFVFRIVCMNEIVGNLVRKREIPRENSISQGVSEKHGENVPGNEGLAEIVSLDIAIV
jgi:hypothetical protein